MNNKFDFTEGKILGPLMRFFLPVLFALFLQALYGAVDLLVVGKFAGSADVSAVSTGSQIMMTITNLISSLAVGITVYLGQKIGEKDVKAGGKIVGAGIFLFIVIGLLMTVLIPVCSEGLAGIMQAPEEAYDLTCSYIRICGAGSIAIILYNLIGSIFRGLGDSRTPLVTVLIACIINIAGDLALVAGFGMGASGAAFATVGAQAVSVIISVILIRKKELPFEFSFKKIRPDKGIIKKILSLGIPIAVQDFLVGISFLVVLAVVNSLGLVASAGLGVAEKVCIFIMLIPLAFMQSMSAFTAQNRGAGKIDRAVQGLKIAICVSLVFAVAMFLLAFFKGDMLSYIFTNAPEVIAASSDYLKAYAIDCLLTCFLFCFIGFFNGMEQTRFVMIQGLIGAFLIRIPVSFIMSRMVPVSMFNIGLATPASSVVQIIMCFVFFAYLRKKYKNDAGC